LSEKSQGERAFKVGAFNLIPGKKRRRLVGVVTPQSAGTLAFGTLQRRGVVMVKYFFGDRSESVASLFGVPSKYAEDLTCI
jgi:hypothetical protein